MSPSICVVIPTCRRPKLLLRAVQSVRAQTLDDWEVVVSDEDGPGGDGAQAVRSAWPSDRRIRVIGNHRTKGQAGNTNSGLLETDAPWIKILHDDDWLLQDALRQLLLIAKAAPDAAIIASDLARVSTGGVQAAPRRWPLLYRIEPQDAWEAMYFWERVGGAPPSCLMAAGRAVRSGALWLEDGIRHMGDRFWKASLVNFGSLVAYEMPLVFYSVEGHQTEGGSRNADQVQRELARFQEMLWPRVQDRFPDWPPQKATQARMTLLALYAIKGGRLPDVANLLRILQASCAGYALRHVLHYASGGRVTRVRRRELKADQILGDRSC